MPTILDHITTIDYAPRTNLKGKGIGANWVFLLPRLELERVLCVGSPAEDMLPALRLLSEDLICTRPMKSEKISVKSIDEIPASSVDLIYLADIHAVTLAQLRRILKPDGLMYYEHYGRDRTKFAELVGTRSRFWLSPAIGNVQTAVSFGHVHSAEFLFDRQLWTSTIRHQTMERLGKRLVGKSSPPTALQGDEELTAPDTSANTKKPLKRILYAYLRRARNTLIQTATRIEHNLLRKPFARRWLQRCGTVFQNGKRVSDEPPRYLQSVAKKSGIDIRHWEWAFVARGDYPSQKLLFYLFGENTNQPSVVAKMVREPQYNERLEREYQGLKHLGDLEFVHEHTIPHILFQGYHRGLFFIGESVLDGQPFAQKASFDSSCHYAQFVVQWLIDLGVTTRADSDGTTVAALLLPLFNRFVKIYNPPPLQAQFLASQLDRLACAKSIPLVLRHGDLGLQNLLITCNDKVAFLDWENAEIKGLSLWDLFHFLSAYCVKAGQLRANLSSLEAYESFFLNQSLLQPIVLDAIDRYCKTIGLDHELVIPLFYMFWMYRALKQSTMISPAQTRNGSAWRVLQLCITMHDSATLRLLS